MSGLIWSALVGLVAGWLTGKIMKGGGYGFLLDIVLGIAGGLLGGWLASLIGIGHGGLIMTLIVSVLGAMLIVFIVRLITRGSGS